METDCRYNDYFYMKGKTLILNRDIRLLYARLNPFHRKY